MTNYQNCKIQLKETAKIAKKEFKNDKPAIRLLINYYCDHLTKTRNLSEYKINLLHNFAGSLHP
jgi:hypothetical protein